MPNILNQPFADALAKTYPAPDGIKIFTASADADKMLAFWSIKQSTKAVVLRIGDELARFILQECPHCQEALSARAVRMSKKEHEMMVALLAMMKQAEPAKPAGKPAKKQPVKPQVQAAPAVDTTEPFEPNSADDITLEELEALTTPGGGQ